MADEDDPFSPADVADSTDNEVAQRRKELDQRERGLADLANELDEREEELDDRAAELRKERKQLDERKEELDEREAAIQQRESSLDKRETALGERERELSDRAAELDGKEQTIQEYVNDSVRDTVRQALAEGLPTDKPSRFGKVGSIVLGLVGVTLIVGGVLNGFAGEISTVPTVFANETANLGVTVLLLFSGLAANLAAVAD